MFLHGNDIANIIQTEVRCDIEPSDAKRAADEILLYIKGGGRYHNPHSARISGADKDRECSIDGGLIQSIAAKAREWAGHYPQSSDGRNTFILFAEWVDGLCRTSPIIHEDGRHE